MTLDDLKHIFRFQTTADADYTPKDTVDYLLIEGKNKMTGTQAIHELENLVVLLDNFEFEGYKDRMPIFVMPESQV
jgi:hypothetical protein